MIDWNAERDELIKQKEIMQERFTRTNGYPFCKTDECPYWRGYCTRDPACNDETPIED